MDALEFPGYSRKPELQELQVSRFDAQAHAWRERRAGNIDARVSSLCVVTWNTWFQGEDRPDRYKGLVGALEACRPDVIMLQEVTIELLDALLAAPWVRNEFHYTRAPFRAEAIPSHGVMLLSRLPVGRALLHAIPTRMGRSLLTVESRINGKSIVFATVHLESMKAHADTRGEQLRAIFSILEREPDVVLAGDFNFCSSSREENSRIDARYADVWPAVRRGEPGYTQDTDRNPMLLHAKREMKKVRIDRVTLRSDAKAWMADSAFLLGTEPVDPRQPRIFPSDHFGVGAVIRASGALL